MDTRLAAGALVAAAVRPPSMFASLPGLFARVDELLFVLLGLLALVAWCLGIHSARDPGKWLPICLSHVGRW